MEIGHHGIDGAKPDSPADEYARRSLGRARARTLRRAFRRCGRGGRLELRTTVVPTAITRPPAARAALIAAQAPALTSRYSACISWRIDVVGPHRLEGARADVQRDEGAAHAARLERGEDVGVEVQARRRRRNGAGHRAHRRSGSARDRRRRAAARYRAAAAPRREPRRKRARRSRTPGETDRPRARACARCARRAVSRVAPASDPCSRARAPAPFARSQHALEQDLDPSAALLRAVYPRGHHAGVVEHQQIARGQQLPARSPEA